MLEPVGNLFLKNESRLVLPNLQCNPCIELGSRRGCAGGCAEGAEAVRNVLETVRNVLEGVLKARRLC